MSCGDLKNMRAVFIYFIQFNPVKYAILKIYCIFCLRIM